MIFYLSLHRAKYIDVAIKITYEDFICKHSTEHMAKGRIEPGQFMYVECALLRCSLMTL